MITETTYVVEKQLGERADVFVEYVGDFPSWWAKARLTRRPRALLVPLLGLIRSECAPRLPSLTSPLWSRLALRVRGRDDREIESQTDRR